MQLELNLLHIDMGILRRLQQESPFLEVMQVVNLVVQPRTGVQNLLLFFEQLKLLVIQHVSLRWHPLHLFLLTVDCVFTFVTLAFDFFTGVLVEP